MLRSSRLLRLPLFQVPFLLVPLLLGGCTKSKSAVISDPPQLLEVMTFNVRYGAAKDGPDRWTLREGHVLGVIEGEAPAILAVQEALDFQVDAILGRTEHFVKVGQHREGGTKNEFSGMFVNGRLLEVEASGDLWLSETPSVIGSVGWDAALTRNATWARFKSKANGKRFVVISTHFDHRGKEARLESARLLGAELGRRCQEGAGEGQPPLPGLLFGDLNAGENSAPLDALRAAGLVDTFRVAHPDAVEVGTFNAFRDERGGAKIDYILATPEWETTAAEVLRPRHGGRCASDHDPVKAALLLR